MSSRIAWWSRLGLAALMGTMIALPVESARAEWQYTRHDDDGDRHRYHRDDDDDWRKHNDDRHRQRYSRDHRDHDDDWRRHNDDGDRQRYSRRHWDDDDDWHQHKHRHHHRHVILPRPYVIHVPPPPVIYLRPPHWHHRHHVAAHPISPVYLTHAGRHCRDYRASIVIGGIIRFGNCTACLHEDGVWRIVG